ncbi:MAG TPA: ARMT1-like domain-containing protein [Thermodesulfovibrionales bacterium]|nr:ARMT1-like domain-containing protein [Thermodesulfovibrionales bacterium]
METRIDCLPCFLKQTVIALRQLGTDGSAHQKVFRDVLAIMQDADMSKPPAYTTTLIHRKIRDTVDRDPFEKVKKEFNSIALSLYPRLRDRVKASRDPLWTASRLAIAGNIIDFGIFTSIDIDGSIDQSLRDDIAVDDYAFFREDLRTNSEILYLLDNAGEIVFDKLLIEELQKAGKHVTAVVKGSAVLNDVTSDDAVQVGLDAVCEVMDNGSDAIGTILPWTSPAFRERFEKAELIISKGQGNFETISETGKRTYFLFQSKCDVVSQELGLPACSMLFQKS